MNIFSLRIRSSGCISKRPNLGRVRSTLFFLAALEAEQNCRPNVAAGIVAQLIRQVTSMNGPSAEGKGIPSPYYSPEQAMHFNYRSDAFNLDQFVGHSYTAEVAIHFLARRWLRQTLASIWFGLTRIALTSYIPANSAEWFRWRSSEESSSTLAGEPQSWGALLTQAETVSVSDLPKTLRERPAFALCFFWYTLIASHRRQQNSSRLPHSQRNVSAFSQ